MKERMKRRMGEMELRIMPPLVGGGGLIFGVDGAGAGVGVLEGVGTGAPLLGDGAGEGTAAFRGAGAGAMLLGDGAGDGVVVLVGLGAGALLLVEGAGDGAGDFLTGGGGTGVDGQPVIEE